jgi:hypothetical protein
VKKCVNLLAKYDLPIMGPLRTSEFAGPN